MKEIKTEKKAKDATEVMKDRERSCYIQGRLPGAESSYRLSSTTSSSVR